MTVRGLVFEIGPDGFSSNIDEVHRDIREALVISMCLTYGAPEDVGPTAPWHDVGTDRCRIALLDEVEDFRGAAISDAERESVRTVADLIELAKGRADA